jgi:hypothetical protein
VGSQPIVEPQQEAQDREPAEPHRQQPPTRPGSRGGSEAFRVGSARCRNPRHRPIGTHPGSEGTSHSRAFLHIGGEH